MTICLGRVCLNTWDYHNLVLQLCALQNWEQGDSGRDSFEAKGPLLLFADMSPRHRVRILNLITGSSDRLG